MLDPSIGFNSAVNGFVSNTQNSSNDGTPKAKSYRYPLRRIESKSDYLEIRIVKYEAPKFVPGNLETKTVNNQTTINEETVSLASIPTGTEANRNTKPLKYIYLPIPQNLSDANSITWGDDTLNPLEAFGLKAGTSLVGNPLGAAAAAGTFFKKFGSEVQGLTEANKDLIASAVGGALVNAVGGSVSYQSILARASGQILNPNLELLFQGVNLRSFPFVFDFAPRDEREAREVKEIIRAFKIHMTPKSTSTGSLGKVFIKSPDVFLVAYKSGNKTHPFLNKFKPMALTDMQLSYTGSGTYSTYQDGTPVHMQMTLTFKELNPIYSEDYETEEGKTGVGY
jgi:hypothetical protein